MQGTLHNEDLFLFDVIIVGAGPAGLSAVLILGRCRRHVLVCDTGQHRNAASRRVQLVMVAAEGAEAAFAFNTALLKEDLA